IAWFMKEGDLAISVKSFLLQVPGIEWIEALEDTVVHFISHAQLEELYSRWPEFNRIGRLLLQKYYILSEERNSSVKMHTAADRYQYLVDHYPELVRRVQAKHLAAYLGITMERLSVIKNSGLVSGIKESKKAS